MPPVLGSLLVTIFVLFFVFFNYPHLKYKIMTNFLTPTFSFFIIFFFFTPYVKYGNHLTSEEIHTIPKVLGSLYNCTPSVPHYITCV